MWSSTMRCTSAPRSTAVSSAFWNGWPGMKYGVVTTTRLVARWIRFTTMRCAGWVDDDGPFGSTCAGTSPAARGTGKQSSPTYSAVSTYQSDANTACNCSADGPSMRTISSLYVRPGLKSAAIMFCEPV